MYQQAQLATGAVLTAVTGNQCHISKPGPAGNWCSFNSSHRKPVPYQQASCNWCSLTAVAYSSYRKRVAVPYQQAQLATGAV
jgi:hypothetical protein